MEKEKAKTIIKWISLCWALIALVLFVLAVTRLIPRTLFEWGFAGGFVVWSILATFLFRLTQE